MIDQFQRELYAAARPSLDATRWDVPPIPRRLVNQVVGAGGTTEGFHYGGFTTALGMRTTLKLLGERLPDGGATLDFGCGPSRVLRWLSDLQHTTLYGADINGEAKNGFFFWRPAERATLNGLPDFYQVAFHSRDYVERTWSRLFEPLLYVSHGPFYEQELIVLRNSRRRLRQHPGERRLPLAVLDSPGAGTLLDSREMLLSGWAFFPDRRGPLAVDIWVDGRRAGRCSTGEARPDVSAAFHSRNGEHSGFRASVSLEHLEGDKHVVWLTLGDNPMPFAATYFASGEPFGGSADSG